MEKANKRLKIMFFAMWVLVIAGSAWGASLPEGLIMREGFRPGIGAPVGNVLQVQGEVVIMHAKQAEGYWARKDLPLFKGDVVVTKTSGRVQLQLVDESQMTLGSETRIEISESVYSRREKSRFSFIRMSLGKARFLVKKLTGLRLSKFKVLTATAIAGIRGTEFIAIDMPGRTDVISIEDPIEVTSLSMPEEVVLVQDLQKTIVFEGQLPSVPEPAELFEIETLNRELVIGQAPVKSGSEIGAQKQPAGTGTSEGSEAKTGTTGETTTGETSTGGEGTQSPGTAGVAETTVVSPVAVVGPETPSVSIGTEPEALTTPIEPLGGIAVLVPEGALVEPVEIDVPEQIEEVITPEIVQEIVQTEQVSEIQQQEDIIKEVVQETLGELPDFPLLPTP